MSSKMLNNIFLTGFMGAGKSTVGKLLSGLLNCAFIDFDDMIVQRESRTIGEIFAVDGEGYFRDCETAILKDLRHQPPVVYATGGGLVIRDGNRNLMKSLGQIVYLKTNWSTLKTRLSHSEGRPLVSPEKNWDKVKDLWIKRQPLYEDADIVVDTDGLTPLQVAQKILSELTS